MFIVHLIQHRSFLLLQSCLLSLCKRLVCTKCLCTRVICTKNQSSPYSISAQARTHWGVLKIQEKIVLLIRTLIEGMMILFQRRHMSAHLVHFWTFAVKVLNVAIFLVDFV